MPYNEFEAQSNSLKRHPSSHSVNPSTRQWIILNMEPMVEVSREGKHDLHNKDTLLEGPSKRTKLSRYSEPPICKKTSTIPTVNQT